jgi:opacity protein-like surface antigen
MISKLKLLAVLASVMSFVAPAFAADSDLIIPAAQEEYVPVEIGSGWYIRGDIGYNIGARQYTETYDLAPTTFSDNYADGVGVGVGAGYRINDIFRVDGTFDRIFGGGFSSTQLVAPTGPCLGYRLTTVAGVVAWRAAGIDNCLRTDRSQYDMWDVMANAYADLATVNGFTPFIGAGIGVAKINWTEETNSITCVPVDANVFPEVCVAQGTVAQPLPNTPYTEPGVLSTGSNWKLAMSVTAGISYEMSKGLHLDTAYKFTSIGGGFGSIPYGSTPGSSIAKDGFGLHQVKVGLRYDIW